MITQNPETTRLIEETVNTFDGDIREAAPADGLSLLDRWISTLHDNSGSADTTQLADTLRDLKLELDPQQSDGPDNAMIQNLLQELIDQTQQLMQTPEASAQQLELQRLVSVLQNLNQQVAQ